MQWPTPAWHMKNWLSKYHLSTRCGLHENKVMNWKFAPRLFFYVSNVFRGGVCLYGSESDDCLGNFNFCWVWFCTLVSQPLREVCSGSCPYMLATSSIPWHHWSLRLSPRQLPGLHQTLRRLPHEMHTCTALRAAGWRFGPPREEGMMGGWWQECSFWHESEFCWP